MGSDISTLVSVEGRYITDKICSIFGDHEKKLMIERGFSLKEENKEYHLRTWIIPDGYTIERSMCDGTWYHIRDAEGAVRYKYMAYYDYHRPSIHFESVEDPVAWEISYKARIEENAQECVLEKYDFFRCRYEKATREARQEAAVKWYEKMKEAWSKLPLERRRQYPLPSFEEMMAEEKPQVPKVVELTAEQKLIVAQEQYEIIKRVTEGHPNAHYYPKAAQAKIDDAKTPPHVRS